MDNKQKGGRKSRESGHAVIEASLMVPWVFFLFVGVLDFGFYAYAAIATENAARVAVLYTSSSSTSAGDSSGACYYALEELRMLPNVGTGTTTCDGSSKVAVTATSLPAGVDGQPASEVVVTYQTIPMIPIPGLLMGQYNIGRVVQMRVLGN